MNDDGLYDMMCKKLEIVDKNVNITMYITLTSVNVNVIRQRQSQCHLLLSVIAGG